MAEVAQRFTLICTGWEDDGFDNPLNATDRLEPQQKKGEAQQRAEASRALYYKFMIRKNGITVPLVEGGWLNVCSMCFLAGACLIIFTDVAGNAADYVVVAAAAVVRDVACLRRKYACALLLVPREI